MLRVRGESMIDAGILDGDYVVARAQTVAEKGDIVVAGIPGEEATVKTYGRKGNKVLLIPSNPALEPMAFDERRGLHLRQGRQRPAQGLSPCRSRHA